MSGSGHSLRRALALAWDRAVAAERGALRILVAVVRATHTHATHDNGTRAAGIAYFALLSFFPLVLLSASLVTAFLGDRPEDVHAVVGSVSQFAPFLDEGFWERVVALLERRGVVSIASALVLFALASRVAVALEQAMAAIFGGAAAEGAGLLRTVLRRLRAHVMTLVVLLTIGSRFIVSTIVGYLESLGIRGTEALQWVLDQPLIAHRVLPALIVGLLAHGLYHRVPRVAVPRRWALLGAAVFVAGHELALAVYTWIFSSRISHFDAVYGSFFGVVALTVWVYWLSSVALFAAEVVAELTGVGRRQRSARRPARETP